MVCWGWVFLVEYLLAVAESADFSILSAVLSLTVMMSCLPRRVFHGASKSLILPRYLWDQLKMHLYFYLPVLVDYVGPLQLLL